MKCRKGISIIGSMKKRWPAILFAFIFMLIFTACGKEPVPEVTTIVVDEEGKVTHTIVEDFSDEDYDAEELKGSIEEKIKEYNEHAGKDSAKLSRFEDKDGRLRVVVDYQTAEDFCEMNDASPVFFYFYGTVEEAENKGIVPEVMLYKDGDVDNVGVNGTGIRKYPHRHFCVLMESAHVNLPYNILFCTENVKVQGEGEADVEIAEMGDKAYILME